MNILSIYKMGLDDEDQANTNLYIDEDDDQWSDVSTDSEMIDQSDFSNEDLVSLYIQVTKPIVRQNETRRKLKRSSIRRLVEGRHVKLSQSSVTINNNTDKLSSPWEKNDFFKAYCAIDDLPSGVDDDEDSADEEN
ncbi:uncharacterized protein LOC126898472 [Daktulosphaira vitifoliae]|uniref:uncharacterized protein LOC126898472 n=1 Tax=Daktulosphaira vitifoliae TaxID=58002 RepID=UPI0021A98C56|nr:uncharacterized protein LOC126898472 [Daktulosphaira vitifoliae]